jgi:hypothetical protein
VLEETTLRTTFADEDGSALSEWTGYVDPIVAGALIALPGDEVVYQVIACRRPDSSRPGWRHVTLRPAPADSLVAGRVGDGQ